MCVWWHQILGTSYVRNSSVSLSPTLARNGKVKHSIRIKTHKPIVLRFWVESGVNVLCGWTLISLVLYLFNKTPSITTLYIYRCILNTHYTLSTEKHSRKYKFYIEAHANLNKCVCYITLSQFCAQILQGIRKIM